MKPAMTVRALRTSDVADVLDGCRDWEELAAYGPPYWRPRNETQLVRKIQAAAGPAMASEYLYVIEDVAGRLVGECSLHAIDWRNGIAQIGACIWAPDDRRSGFGRFAVQEMAKWARDYLRLRRVEGWIVGTNVSSLALCQSLGFRTDAILPSRYWTGGSFEDMHVVSLDLG